MNTRTYRITFQRCMALLLAISLIASTVRASASTVVKVEPYQSNAEVSQTFSINITIVDVENLYGLEVALFWDPSVLEVVGTDVRLGYESHSDGVLHEIPVTASVQIYENETRQEQGTYVLAASSIAPAPSFSGSGTIARVTFQAKSDGSCNLRLQTKLYDKPPIGQVSEQILHTTQDGVFGEVSEVLPLLYIATAVVVVAAVALAGLYVRAKNQKAKKPNSSPAP